MRRVKTLRPQRGQFLYELNLSTGVISEIDHNKIGATVNLINSEKWEAIVHKRVDTNENCIYCCAINFKNAERKFKKIINKHKNEV